MCNKIAAVESCKSQVERSQAIQGVCVLQAPLESGHAQSDNGSSRNHSELNNELQHLEVSNAGATTTAMTTNAIADGQKIKMEGKEN